ncbi:uncharacterized histidine-rich protein DDB_G0274557-like [Panicum virgatum]|uniref:Uncharacterized protein n=1 Tax=Panicum virgatum TaxID=38727 RepID=A0A8T0STF8_PANVG|nr:uncharacterized histidine-rich protein DDB_G0274557-like [Panicum virgatum]KAG2602892.1 hypothetical protein PVAP13_5KG718600 [Panicum virgatum]
MNPPHPGPGLPCRHHHLLHLHLDPRHHHHVHIHLCHHHHHGAHLLAPAPPAHLHHQHQVPAPVFFPNANGNAAPWQPEPPPAAVGEDVGELDPEPGLLHAEGAEDEEPVFVLTDEWAEFFAKSDAKRRLAKQQKKNKGRK